MRKGNIQMDFNFYLYSGGKNILEVEQEKKPWPTDTINTWMKESKIILLETAILLHAWKLPTYPDMKTAVTWYFCFNWRSCKRSVSLGKSCCCNRSNRNIHWLFLGICSPPSPSTMQELRILPQLPQYQWRLTEIHPWLSEDRGKSLSFTSKSAFISKLSFHCPKLQY